MEIDHIDHYYYIISGRNKGGEGKIDTRESIRSGNYIQ